LAEQESLPELMTEEELEQMQSFFTDQAAFTDRQQTASDTLQDWLRWLLLLLLLLEVLWVLKRLLRPEASPT
jgi:flagellar biogenesis protein FliO